MFTKFNLYIGLNDKDSKVQEISTIDAYKIIGAICGDCTITEGKGLYTHQDGTQVLETSLIVQIIDFSGTLDIVPVVDTMLFVNKLTVGCCECRPISGHWY